MNATDRRPSLYARLAYLPQADGPHVLLGVGWFVLVTGAATIGRFGICALFAAVGGIASLQTVRDWRARGYDADRVVAASAVVAMAVAGLVSAVAVLAVAVVGLVVTVAADSMSRRHAIVATVRSWLPIGVCIGACVVIARADMGAFVILFVLVSAFEVGNYLVGTGSNSVFEGPVAGMAAVLVITFAEAVFQLGPFDTRAAWIFGAVVAVLAPLGAPVASAVASSARAAGPALRRLDAWMVVAPMWAWMLHNWLVATR